jgi:GT2 family glycosyltransferase
MPAEGFRHVAGATVASPGGYDADIVILALNRADETLQAIASALAQEDVRFHLIILDQGSSPETLAKFACAVERRADATLVASDRNLGVAGGRNLANALGHGRIIVGLDNDASFASADTVAQAVAVFDGSPDLGAIGFRILRHDTGQEDLSSWGYPAGLLARAGDAFDTVTFVGAGHAIRRTAWDQAGGYDIALFFCWEEFDFCLRAVQAGWRIRYRGDIVVHHHVASEARMRWSDARWFYFIRNRLYIGHKTGAGRWALALRFVFYALRSLSEGALVQALRALPAAVRLARNVPRQPLSPATLDYLWRNDSLHRRPAWLQSAPAKAPPPPPREALLAWRR